MRRGFQVDVEGAAPAKRPARTCLSSWLRDYEPGARSLAIDGPPGKPAPQYEETHRPFTT